MGPKPQKECEGGEAHSKDDDSDECPWRFVLRRKKNSENNKRSFYTDHVTGSDQDNRASGTAEY
jgi:hypothetical protein